MKKAIKQFFLIIFVIVLVILCGVVAIIMLPLDYIKYKRSPYYKKERKKYTFFAAAGEAFELYNEIIKNDLPVRYYENPNDPSLSCGWFVLDDTLIIVDIFSFEFDAEEGIWKYGGEEDAEADQWMTLEEYIQEEIRTANELTGQVICKDAVLLVDGDSVDDLEQAKAEKRFLVYENNREEVIKQFCNDPTGWRT